MTLFLTTASVFAQLTGDVNLDGCVNISDLAIVGRDFGQTGVGLPSDVNGDGVVNVFDLVIVASQFGEGSCTFPPTLLGGADVSIDQPNIPSLGVGDQFTVDIRVTGAINVAGYQFGVTFDPTVFSFVSIQNSDFLPAGSFATPPFVMTGKVTLAAISLAGPASGDGTLAQATFQVVQLQASTLGLVNVALSNPDGALPVELVTFTGTVTSNGVRLRWRTQTETNNLGFHVYRSKTKDGNYVRITPTLIKGHGTDATPHDYQFVDDTAEIGKTYYYYIEDVDFSGKTDQSLIIKVGSPTSKGKLTTTWAKIKTKR